MRESGGRGCGEQQGKKGAKGSQRPLFRLGRKCASVSPFPAHVYRPVSLFFFGKHGKVGGRCGWVGRRGRWERTRLPRVSLAGLKSPLVCVCVKKKKWKQKPHDCGCVLCIGRQWCQEGRERLTVERGERRARRWRCCGKCAWIAAEARAKFFWRLRDGTGSGTHCGEEAQGVCMHAITAVALVPLLCPFRYGGAGAGVNSDCMEVRAERIEAQEASGRVTVEKEGGKEVRVPERKRTTAPSFARFSLVRRKSRREGWGSDAYQKRLGCSVGCT